MKTIPQFKLHASILVLLLAISLPAFGQRVKTWVEAEEKETFKHGRFALPVSSSVDLVSLHYDTFQYTVGQGVPLQMQFHAPSQDNFFLHLDERIILAYYRLESNPGQIEKGANIFGPLDIDPIIQYFGIPANNLGVLVHLGDDDSNQYLPVQVYTSDQSVRASIRAIFRFGKAISSGSYQVFKGTYKGVLPQGEPSFSGLIGRKMTGSLLEISMDTTGLSDYTGWLTAYLSLQEKGTIRVHNYRFFFYHQAP